VLFLLLAWGLVGCSTSTAPVVKIGLVAPFEGRYRAIGYEAIYAARLAIREINAAGGVQGVRVELLALDDGGDPLAAIEQARKLAIDPQVVAVLGHFRPDTTSAAIDTYCAEAIPLLAVASDRVTHCSTVFALTPVITDSLLTDPLLTDPSSFLFVATVPHPADLAEAADFVTTYNAIPIDGTRAGPIALQTYDAMYLVFDALGRDIGANGHPSRQGMIRALAESNFKGLEDVYRFDAGGQRSGARVFVFRYRPGRQPEVLK
jgi:ABC-type branched-subunit amino acid transport system substrate-binding protein